MLHFHMFAMKKSDGNNEAVEESKREGPVELTEKQLEKVFGSR